MARRFDLASAGPCAAAIINRSVINPWVKIDSKTVALREYNLRLH